MRILRKTNSIGYETVEAAASVVACDFGASIANSGDDCEAFVKDGVPLLPAAAHKRRCILARLLWAGDNRDTERRMHDAFISELQKAGLRVVDMKPVLEKTGDPLACYFQSDPHWNARGHALAAQELFQALQSSPASP